MCPQRRFSRGVRPQATNDGIEEARLVVKQRLAVEFRHRAACSRKHRVTRGGVPFAGVAGARVDIGFAPGHEPELERRRHRPAFGHVILLPGSAASQNWMCVWLVKRTEGIGIRHPGADRFQAAIGQGPSLSSTAAGARRTASLGPTVT